MLLSTYEVMYLVLIVAVVTIFFCGYYIIGFFGNIAEGDDELDEEIDLRAKRQREALVCVRPEDESEFQKIKQHQKYTVSTTQKFFKKKPLTPFLYCLGPRVAEPKKWFFPNFIFKGWEWCIWNITTIIHHQI